MAVKRAAEIQNTLTDSVKRLAAVRRRKTAEREAGNQPEGETVIRPLPEVTRR